MVMRGGDVAGVLQRERPLGSAVVAALVLMCLLGTSLAAMAAPVAVRFVEGSAQTFLTLRSPTCQEIALGEFQQVPKGHTVQNQHVFRFKDGSVHDERAVFSQRDVFRLEQYHLQRHGPVFPVTIDASLRNDGNYSVKSRKKDKQEAVDEGHLDLPPDVYNGIVMTLLKNIPKGATETEYGAR